MAAVQVLTSIGIIAISFLLGFVFYWLVSPLNPSRKKEQTDAAASLLINFVVFVWLGKILLHLPVFLQDPIAVLAYPSNSGAFYIATGISALHIAYKIKRKQIDAWMLLYTFMQVFLFASFLYGFIQMVWLDAGNKVGDTGLHGLLLISLLLLQHRVSKENLLLGLFIIWSLGELVLSFVLPNITVFGYMMAPGFFGILLAAGLLASLFRLGKVRS